MAPVLRYDHDTLEQQLKDTIQSLYQILVQVSTYDNTTASTITTPLHPSSISSPAPAPAPAVSSAPPYTSASTRSPAPNSSNPAGGGGGGASTRDVLANEIRALERSLQAVHRTATTPSAEASLPPVPPELIQYVEGGRNPDIYTREFVELVRRGNQLVRGKQAAFASFRDVLAAEMEKAMPELRDDAARVVAATTPAPPASGGGGGGGGGGTGS